MPNRIRAWCGLVLALGCASAVRGQELVAEVPAETKEEGLDRALRLRLAMPLAGPRNSFFFSGFGLPLLRGAWVPPEGTLLVRLRFSETHSADTAIVDGQRNRFDGTYIEHARLELELALHERVSLRAELRVAGWDERRDVFLVRDHTGVLVIQGEAKKAAQGFSTSRHENLAVFSLAGLVSLLRDEEGASALGVSLALKLPGFRRGDITNSGTGDIALGLAGSLGLLDDRVVLHADGGLVAPLGKPWIFQQTGAFDAQLFFQAGLGLTVVVTEWLSLGASIEGATSPWKAPAFLDRPAATLSGGARFLLGRFTIEAGVGTGLGAGSADWLAWVELGWISRPLWEP